MTGSLNPESSECQVCFGKILFCILGPWDYPSRGNFVFAEVRFRMRYGAPYVRGLRKARVNLYRRTPQIPTRTLVQRQPVKFQILPSAVRDFFLTTVYLVARTQDSSPTDQADYLDNGESALAEENRLCMEKGSTKSCQGHHFFCYCVPRMG